MAHFLRPRSGLVGRQTGSYSIKLVRLSIVVVISIAVTHLLLEGNLRVNAFHRFFAANEAAAPDDMRLAEDDRRLRIWEDLKLPLRIGAALM
jgi:hypothetical protein